MKLSNGDKEFEVDGKKYPVKSVDKDDKENAKKFANESKSMKLTSMLNESFGFGELPSSKLKKMKMSFKEVLELDKEEMAKLHKDGELDKDGEKIVFNEKAPRMKKSKEETDIEKTMAIVSGLQKGGLGNRYNKEFEKAKRRALKAVTDMLTYAKIGG